MIVCGRGFRARTYVPESQGVQAWDRYAYTFEGYSVGGDAFFSITDTESKGQAINPDGKPFIDPISQRPVKFDETAIGRGINIYPNVAEFGGFSGKTITEIKKSSQFPWWPNKVVKE